jgi:hypothetical protein
MPTLMHPNSDLGRQWREKREQLEKKLHDVSPDLDGVKASASTTMADAVDAVKERRDSLPTIAELTHGKPTSLLKHLSDDVGGVIAGLAEMDTPDLKAFVETHVAPLIGELRQRAAHLAGDVVETSSHDKSPANQVANRFTESLAQAEQALGSWRGAAAGHVESAQTQVRSAGVQAREGGKNAAASAFWLGAAAAVVYGGLLNEHQRQWVNEKSKAIANETVGMIKDLRGRDGEFSS